MENTNEIPFECAASVKELVGKTIISIKGDRFNVLRWEGQNLILRNEKTNAEGPAPAMLIINQRKLGNFKFA